jgi:HAD superfamily phosphatase
VHHYCGWEPGHETVDALKGEGHWNNDWDASLELLRRHALTHPSTAPSSHSDALPSRADLIDVFSRFYFGSDPEGDPFTWDGFICDEPLLVDPSFFASLTNRDIRWGFVSGAEPPSARFLLEQRLGLQNPPLIAMGDAPDKPDPEGLIRLASTLVNCSLGSDAPLIAYLGDTVADVHTVMRAREQVPQQRWMSLAVVPPHLHSPGQSEARTHYEENLRAAGAEVILTTTQAALNWDPNQV